MIAPCQPGRPWKPPNVQFCDRLGRQMAAHGVVLLDSAGRAIHFLHFAAGFLPRLCVSCLSMLSRRPFEPAD